MIALKRQRYANAEKSDAFNGPKSTISEITTLRDDMISVGDAIIAGVRQASTDSASNADASTPNTNASGKKHASSGSVGEFLAKRRKPAPNNGNTE